MAGMILKLLRSLNQLIILLNASVNPVAELEDALIAEVVDYSTTMFVNAQKCIANAITATELVHVPLVMEEDTDL